MGDDCIFISGLSDILLGYDCLAIIGMQGRKSPSICLEGFLLLQKKHTILQQIRLLFCIRMLLLKSYTNFNSSARAAQLVTPVSYVFWAAKWTLEQETGRENNQQPGGLIELSWLVDFIDLEVLTYCADIY